MQPTAELRKDHDILRAKLLLLEGLLPLTPTTQFPIREFVYSIARRLRCHTEKEDVLLGALHAARHGRPTDATRYLPEEHQDQQQTLTVLNRLLAQGLQCPGEQVTTYGAHLIDELRDHMAREESTLFPLVNQLINEQHSQEVAMEMQAIARRHYPEGEPLLPVLQARPVIAPEMTVNHVLRIDPAAREIFRAFHVDWCIDGHHCLDELYWRRGIDVEALLQTLNRTAAETSCAP